MLSITASTRIFISAIPTDMRKGFDGLQGIVSGVLQQDPLDGFQKIAISSGHREVDGIEIRLTVEAADQVFPGIVVRAAFIAAGTDEDQLTVPSFMRPLKTAK